MKSNGVGAVWNECDDAHSVATVRQLVKQTGEIDRQGGKWGRPRHQETAIFDDLFFCLFRWLPRISS